MDREVVLDASKRSAVAEKLQESTFDLLVVGGGITGAGIALDAVTRGLSVALLEKEDFGAGTSSKSTKLIHGGLRYLKQFEFRLVREVGRERAILHRNAPHIVVPEQMVVPVVPGGTYGKFSLWLGLTVYDWLAGVKKDERKFMVNATALQEMEPGVRLGANKGAGIFTEYRTDDARLVIEVIKTAVFKGAVCLNHARADQLLYKDGKVTGVQAKDELSGKTFEIQAHQVVNAAGPWVDDVRRLDRKVEGKRLRHTKGVHLVFAHERLPLKNSMYFDVGDGRMIFAIPRDQWTYVGTTDTDYRGDIDHFVVTAGEAAYLLGACNKMFPASQLERSDVVSTWAGVRPLIHEEGKSPSELSRKDEIFYSPSGLVSIAGGKLTGFRKMAQRVTDVVVKRMRKQFPERSFEECHTDSIELYGGHPDGREAVLNMGKDLAVSYPEIAEAEFQWLLNLYGTEVWKVMAHAPENSRLGVVLGALRYSMSREAVCTLSDFFIRRTALLYFGRPWITPVLDAVKAEMKAFGKGLQDIDPDDSFARSYAEAVEFPERE